MKSYDKSNLIIEEANSIINSFIKKKTNKKPIKLKTIFLSVLTMSLAIILVFVIRNI